MRISFWSIGLLTAVLLGLGGLWGWTLWRYQALSEETTLHYTLIQRAQDLLQEVDFLAPNSAANRLENFLENFYQQVPPKERRFFSKLPMWVQRLRENPSEEEKHNFLQFFLSSLSSYIQYINYSTYASELRFLWVLGFSGLLIGLLVGWGLFAIAGYYRA